MIQRIGALCAKLAERPGLDLYGDEDASRCELAAAPSIRAAAGYGPIVVNGFGYGRVHAQREGLG